MGCLYEIANEDKSLRAVVNPYSGGMLVQVFVDGRACLRYFPENVQLCSTEAGGNPVLFPFPSATSPDGYVVDGKTYYMPFHGLVKNTVFKVEEYESDRIVLSVTNNEAWMSSSYPYDFKLFVEYRIEGKDLFYDITIENRSDKELPHYFGTHTYFLASDKKTFELEHFLTVHLGPDGKPNEMPPLNDFTYPYDDLFYGTTKNEFTVQSKADGYRCHVTYSEEFACTVIWTGGRGAVCIEPWCGLPDSINKKDFIQYVKPGESQKLTMKYEFEAI